MIIFDVPATVTLVHEIQKSGVLSQPVQSIAPVKATKVADLLKAREDIRDEMIARGVTPDRIAALTKYTDQLIGLGWAPSL